MLELCYNDKKKDDNRQGEKMCCKWDDMLNAQDHDDFEDEMSEMNVEDQFEEIMNEAENE